MEVKARVKKRKRRKNKAGYAAIPVADGRAGAEMRGFTLFDSCTLTDGRADGRTEALIELRVRN